MYAQLDRSSDTVRRVILIGDESVGIMPFMVEDMPDMFINLEGRKNIPENDYDWYYNVEEDTFFTI